MKNGQAARILCIAAAVLLLVLGITLSIRDISYTSTTTGLIGTHKTGVGQLTADTEVSQTFRVTGNGFYTLNVMFSNYNKKVKSGTLTLRLTNEAGETLAQQTYDVSGLKNNAFVTLDLPEDQKDSDGKKYTLYASSDCTDEKGVTLRMGPVDAENADVVMTEADGTVTQTDALNLRFTCRTGSYNWMTAITLLLPAMCFAACIPLTGRKEKKHA